MMNVNKNLQKYLEMEKALLSFTDQDSEEYNAWLDNMDSVWLSLTDEEQEYLSKRNLMEPFIGVEPII